MRLELDPDEIRVLSHVLDTSLSELSSEIADTDRQAYRDILKQRAQVLRRILDRLGEATPGPRPPPPG